ncbi:probable chitinase 10 [Amphibalanus amphitrite]|uniref:probable chitinase 10 n=1 Tax=Amphibalanus amphitrite TaxID=1232801 RepID=UPI001C8FDEF4|nr:probable chitinase 10 [Amphibalanus amphitrite]
MGRPMSCLPRLRTAEYRRPPETATVGITVTRGPRRDCNETQEGNPIAGRPEDVKHPTEQKASAEQNHKGLPVYRVVKQRRRRPGNSATAAKSPHDAQRERVPNTSSVQTHERRRKKKDRSGYRSPSRSQVTGGPRSGAPSSPLPDDKEGRKIVCYYTNWSQYRPGLGRFLPENLDPFLCTHIVFAFSSMSENRLSPFEENDLTMSDGGPGLYEQVTALKQVNPRLRVLLALGGWSFGTKKFRDMTRNRYNRRTFVYSVAPYLRDKNFDGLDFDWEYPKGATDKNNFAQLCRELRESFEEEAEQSDLERLLLTAAVPVGPDTVRRGYDVRELARHLDLFHLMAYDFHGQWESQAGHHSPLNAPLRDVAHRRQLSVNASVHMWMDMGAPAHKIVLGVPTYGRSFTLATTTNTGVNAPTRGGGIPGPYTNEEGILAYYEICQRLHSGAVYIWDHEMSAPYIVDGDQWVGFDDERSVRIKMDFVKELGLAGAMVWAVDMDDFTATGCQGAVYPLITAIREELLGVARPDLAPDIDWSAVAGRPVPQIPTNPPEPLLPVLSQLSAADILAILTAHGISPDSATIQKLQAQVARAQTPASPAYRASENVQRLDNPIVEENLAPPKVFCYITDWSRFRPGRGQFRPRDLDPDLCTHVVWAFAGLSQDRLQLPSPDQRRSDPDSDYQQLLRLKEVNADLKILVSLGGSVVDNEQFRELTSSDYRMNTFVYDTVDSIRRLRLDGLELAWEYPSGNEDKDAYSRLIKEFRLAFNSEASANERARLLLTASLPGFPADLQNEYNIQEVSEHVDLLNLLAFDLHDTLVDVVRHGAPLFPLQSATPKEQRYLSVDGAARTLLEEGAAPEKVLIGLATYGRSFTLKHGDQYDIDAPHLGAGKAGKFTGDPGFAAYFEICEFLDQENTTLIWDAEQQVPFAFNGDYWVGFDDEKSLEKKVEWLRELGLGGVSIWSADLDDFSGACGGGRYTLMSAVREALRGYRVRYTYDGVTVTPGARSRPGAILPLTAVGAAEPVTCTDGDNDVTYHRDPLDCRHYYLCQGRVRHRMPCPSGLVFNEEQSVCDWPENVERCWG